MIRNIPRERDVEILMWLAGRSAGGSIGQVARIFGQPKRCVSVATANVLAADLAESGEAAEIVRAGYWQ
jgi:ABC-type amino acid transport system permease subunit